MAHKSHQAVAYAMQMKNHSLEQQIKHQDFSNCNSRKAAIQEQQLVVDLSHRLWDDQRGKCRSSMCPLLIAFAAMRKKKCFQNYSVINTWHTAQTDSHTCCISGWVWLGAFLPQLVPGSCRPAGAVTRGCGAPSPWAAWRRGSISGSWADALPSS